MSYWIGKKYFFGVMLFMIKNKVLSVLWLALALAAVYSVALEFTGDIGASGFETSYTKNITALVRGLVNS